MYMMANSWIVFGLACFCLINSSSGVLVLPNTPPKGFNTFDSYPGLNHSTVMQLASALKEQLLPSGYEYLVLDGGWADNSLLKEQVMDEYGRPLPDPNRFPLGMKALAAELKAMGLKLGLWNIRGINVAAVAKNLQIKGTNYTFQSPGFVDEKPVGGGPNGSCLWDKAWLGVNKSHPAAQAYYDSRIELYAEWDIPFLKADCMMCGPCYTDEMNMYTEAVKKSDTDIMLSYSPGGGNNPNDGKWVAEEKICTMYRIVTDFHGGWYGWGGLQQAIFIAGNFTAAGLNGANGTFTDNDMLPLGPSWWSATPNHHNWSPELATRGQTIITLDMISRSALMHAGVLPTDAVTLAYETNPIALQVHAHGYPKVVGYQGNCTCAGGSGGSCTIPHTDDKHSNSLVTTANDDPCFAVWTSVVPNEFTAIAVFNMGEANGSALINLEDVSSWIAVDDDGVNGEKGGHPVSPLAPPASLASLEKGSASLASLDASQDFFTIDIWTGKKSGPVVWPLKVDVDMHGAMFLKLVTSPHTNTSVV